MANGTTYGFLGNEHAMKNLFTPLSFGSNLWNVWNDYRVANKNYKLEKNKFNYMKLQNEDEKRRRAQMQNNFNTGFGGV